jgi:hypothetical protein
MRLLQVALQVLRPVNPKNDFVEFDIVPEKYRFLIHGGKVLIENWHRLAEESEHKEGDATHAVVNQLTVPVAPNRARFLGDCCAIIRAIHE